MATIRKRRGIWHVDYYYKGKRYRQSLNTTDKKVAELARKKIEVDIAREEFDIASPQRLEFSDFALEFLEWYQTQNSEKSFRDYKNLFTSTIIPHFKSFILNDITARHIEQYKQKRKAVIQEGTVNKELTALKHLFNKAIQWNMIKENPLKHVKKLRIKQKKFRFLSLEEISLVLAHSEGIVRVILMTAIHTGMRRSELFRLEWNDVNFEAGYIEVSNKEDEHTKNYQNREIPMTMQLAECLKSMQRKSSYVFVKDDGTRYTQGIRKSIQAVIVKSNVQMFTLHDLRHTFASHLVMEGVDLPTVQKLMGHANISTTMIYTHLAPDHLRNAINRLEGRFDGHNLVTKDENRG